MAGPGARWRVFCAIEVPEPVQQLLLDHSARLQKAVPEAKVSWSRNSNLHLTLKFFGEIPRGSVADLSSAAARAVAGHPPFAVRLEQTGVFPRTGQARVLWVGINDFSGKLGQLQARLESEAARVGFDRDPRPFHPHLTIARVRRPQPARTLTATHLEMEFAPVEIAVAELLVVRSELSSEGSKYTVVSRHCLR